MNSKFPRSWVVVFILASLSVAAYAEDPPESSEIPPPPSEPAADDSSVPTAPSEPAAQPQESDPNTTETVTRDGNKETRTKESNDQDVKSYSNVRESVIAADPNGLGWAGFMGLGLGYGTLSSSYEISKKGVLARGQVSISQIQEKAVYDGSLGWLYSNMSGSGTVGATTYNSVKVITQIGMVDLSPRYRFTERFELGPLGRVLFGTDASFGEDNEQASAHIFVGAKAMWAWYSPETHYRFGVDIATDITIRNRQVWQPMAVFEIGIPLSRNKTILREKETVRVERKKETKFVKETNMFAFDDEVVHFETDSSVMYPESKEFFYQLGQFLAASPDVYEKLVVDGHTDSRGSDEHNLILSRDRAKAVVDVLIAGGVPAERTESNGYGETRPVDPAENQVAWARNRRVEITFGETANGKKLHEEIRKIKLRTIKPKTCEGPDCK